MKKLPEYFRVFLQDDLDKPSELSRERIQELVSEIFEYFEFCQKRPGIFSWGLNIYRNFRGLSFFFAEGDRTNISWDRMLGIESQENCLCLFYDEQNKEWAIQVSHLGFASTFTGETLNKAWGHVLPAILGIVEERFQQCKSELELRYKDNVCLLKSLVR